jgi:hypothetical protein
VIHADADFVAYPLRADIDLPLLSVAAEDIADRPETLEGIAKLPPTGRDIIRFVGDADGVVQTLLQRGHGQPWAIVLHGQGVGLRILRDRDDRRLIRVFGGIEGIVDEFLEDGEPPAIRGHAELHRELAFGKKLERAAGGKDRSGDLRCRHLTPTPLATDCRQ